jgi:molecular chaperone DnaK (HSP70)
VTLHWGIDVGQSNTTVCVDREGRPRVVRVPELAKEEPLTQTPVIPTCVSILDAEARRVLVGQAAVSYNWDGSSPGYAAGFKRYLGQEDGRVLARVGGRGFSAEEVAALFLEGLMEAAEATVGEEVTDVTFSTPCGSFELYRAQLRRIVTSLRRPPLWVRLLDRLRGRRSGVRVRTVDEPVAAALGYGVDVGRAGTLVAFDFGAGSMEAAAIRMEGTETARSGRARVLAKEHLSRGGEDVDRWILETLVPRALHDWPEWETALRWEAERTKLLASSGQEGAFVFRNETFGTVDYHSLQALLAERGLYREAEALLRRLLRTLDARHGVGPGEVDAVVLEGGSTLLPAIRETVAGAFDRDRIREWLPFESVARGASLFGSGRRIDDFIYHDYGLRVRRDDGRMEYQRLIPRGTSFPTAPDHVVRYYAPGFDGQEAIHLYVCEVGRAGGKPVEWETRDDGREYFVPSTQGERALCPCLNEADPALPLRPPGQGPEARLRVSYSVDADRWLSVTVHDLRRGKDLQHRRPVVKLR